MVKRILPVILIGMLFLAGAGLMLYPVFSSWYMDRHQGAVVADYDEKAAQLSEKQMEEELENARKYNEQLLGNVVLTDPFNAEGVAEQNQLYDYLLNIGEDGVMGSIEIPKIEVYLPIYHGTGSESLEKGAGHLQNSSLPVGGIGTHSVISGHTALPTSELFNRLTEMEESDIFYIHVLKETLAYQVDQIKVVLPEDISDLLIDREQDYVTLVTCTPYGINSHRLLVRGTRIPYEEAIQKEKPGQKKGNPFAGAYIAAAVLAVVILLFALIRRFRKKRKAGAEEKAEGAKSAGNRKAATGADGQPIAKRPAGAKPAGKGKRPTGAQPAGKGKRPTGSKPVGTQQTGKGKRPAGAQPAGKGKRPAGAKPAGTQQTGKGKRPAGAKETGKPTAAAKSQKSGTKQKVDAVDSGSASKEQKKAGMNDEK